MIELRVRKYLETGSYGAAFRIIRAIDHARNSRLHDGPRAHRTRFKRHIQRHSRQAIVSNDPRGLAQYHHFGVRRGVTVANRAIIAARNHLIVLHENGSYRNLAGFTRQTRFRKRQLDVLSVGHRNSASRLTLCRKTAPRALSPTRRALDFARSPAETNSRFAPKREKLRMAGCAAR